MPLTALEGRGSPRAASAAPTAQAAAPSYARHVPERMLLYALVQAHYLDFIAGLEAEDRSLPAYVREEFEAFLRCGVLENGFLRVVCEHCHAERLLAFSCKKRGFCPSCGARCMAESARHLAEEVFGPRPVRQWVLSVPVPLRLLFANKPDAIGPVLGIVHRVIAGWLAAQPGVDRASAQCGTVTLIQRFGSALNLNIHLHMLCLDGVYAPDRKGKLRLHRTRAPKSAQLTALAGTVAHRVCRHLTRQGWLEGEGEGQPASLPRPLGAACAPLAAGHGLGRRAAYHQRPPAPRPPVDAKPPDARRERLCPRRLSVRDRSGACGST